MTKAEIEKKIADAKANKFMPEALRDKYIKDQEAKLAKLESETNSQPKTEEPKSEPKEKKVRKKIEKKPTRTVTTVSGKTITPKDPDFCKEAEAKWYARRAEAKKSARKAKTTPVFNKITGDVAHSVMKAVKSVSVAEIKKDPAEFKKEAHALGSAAKSFLKAFKDILGSGYKASEIESEFSELEKVVNALIKKHETRLETGGTIENEPIIENGKVEEEPIVIEATTAASEEPITVEEEVIAEKDIERALKLASKAAKNEIHATDTSFNGFKNRVKDSIDGDHSDLDLKLAYDCLHVAGFNKGGKISRKMKMKWAKFGKVMREFYHGKLKTHNRVVKKRAQAQAIAYSESGVDRKN